MLRRHDISDDHWNRIQHLLSGRAGQHGGVGNDNRLLLNAIRSLAKTAIAWADLLTYFGKPNSLWQRYNRWCERGRLGSPHRRVARRRNRMAQRRLLVRPRQRRGRGG